MASPENNRPRPPASSISSPYQSPPRPDSSSSPTFTFRTSHTPTSSVDLSSPTPSFNFSPPPADTAAPSSNRFLAGGFPSGRPVRRSLESRSRFSPRIFTPTSSQASTTSTARDFFAGSDTGAGSPQRAESIESADEGSSSSSSFPYLNVSTYRDLYNATPSPQPEYPIAVDQQSAAGIDSLQSPSWGSATPQTHELAIRSIEAASAESEEDTAEDAESESSDEESDDDNTYSVREEELPREPIYDARLQNSLREVRSHLAALATSMRRSELVRDEATDIQGLYGRVEAMSRFEYPETRTVGFIGDSGVGKSSLINSLLDHEGLARSSGNGNACTSVVTEFRHTDETHPQPYTIEADFMTADEQKELLQELMRSYRLRHTGAFREITNEVTAEESRRIETMSQRAWDTLRSLFPGQGALTEEFLSDEQPGSEGRILRQIEQWAMSGLHHRPGGPEALHYRVEASNMDECRENLDSLTVFSSEPGVPAIWPFVKLIRVYLRSPILRTGLVVADLPGFRDLNYARVRAAERYLRHVCDEVFVVSQIGRCRSDESITEIKERFIRDHQPLRIVATQSETGLNAEESIRDSEMPERVRAQARQLQDQINQLERTRTRMANRRRRSSGVTQAHYAIQEADAGQRLEFELMSLLIEARNELSARGLTGERMPDVKVFCVSSRLYADHRRVNGEQATEYIRLSGIPDLRRYCQSVPAEAQLRATTTFLETRVPALLGSLHGWVLRGSNSVSVERAATLRRVLDEAQETLQSGIMSRRSCIRSLQTDLTARFHNCIVDYIRDSRDDWKAEAIRTSQSWRAMHAMTYAAFCRKNGVHQPGRGSMRYWNDEILGDGKEELAEQWKTLLDWLPTEVDKVEEALHDIFQLISASLEDHIHLAPEAIENLLDNLDNQRTSITDTIQRAVDDLNTQIWGSDARRKDLMDSHIRHGHIFRKLLTNVKADYTDMVTRAFNTLRNEIGREVGDITRDLAAAVAVDGEVTEPGRDPELAEIVRDGVSELQSILTEAHFVLSQLQGDAVA
ncbi:hypothetical protein BDV18DRAFT_161210 [Aspergillus unguis]